MFSGKILLIFTIGSCPYLIFLIPTPCHLENKMQFSCKSHFQNLCGCELYSQLAIGNRPLGNLGVEW